MFLILSLCLRLLFSSFTSVSSLLLLFGFLLVLCVLLLVRSLDFVSVTEFDYQIMRYLTVKCFLCFLILSRPFGFKSYSLALVSNILPSLWFQILSFCFRFAFTSCFQFCIISLSFDFVSFPFSSVLYPFPLLWYCILLLLFGFALALYYITLLGFPFYTLRLLLSLTLLHIGRYTSCGVSEFDC